MSEQETLIQNICSSLIDCTPEHWYSAVLLLSKSEAGIEHQINSNDGHSDIVSPSNELFLATRKFELFLKSKFEMFQTAKFNIWLNDLDQWQFESEFTYENT